jgi:hypothetical protein
MHAIGGTAPDVSVLVQAEPVGKAARDLVKFTISNSSIYFK